MKEYEAGEANQNTKKKYPDPLAISPINPIDFRYEHGVCIHDPGWWKSIPEEYAKERKLKAPKKR